MRTLPVAMTCECAQFFGGEAREQRRAFKRGNKIKALSTHVGILPAREFPGIATA